MAQEYAFHEDLKRLNNSLSCALIQSQDYASKLDRKISYLTEDLGKANAELANSKAYAASLEQLLLRVQQQPANQPAPTSLFHTVDPSQRKSNAVSFLEHSTLAGTLHSPKKVRRPVDLNDAAPLHPSEPKEYGRSLFQHSLAGTLHSPSKARRPLNDVNSNAPLKISDLRKSDAAKRAPVNSPPAKQAPKRQANGPTPRKISASRAQSKAAGNSCAKQQTKQQTEVMTLVELRKASWTKSSKAPSPATCRPLLTAIHRASKGDIAIVMVALEWLAENIPACRSLAKEQTTNGASKIVSNIESWLQHNLGDSDKRGKGGTLPLEMEHALQAVCSAAMFSKDNVNILEVQRLLPSIGGRKRLNTTKELNAKMMKDGCRFFLADRKQRKDTMWPLLCLFVRRQICWNDKYTRVDTNYSRKIKCKEPQVQEMEGGGFRFLGWKIEERPMRMWYEETTLADVMKLVLASDEYKQLKAEYPNVSLSRRSLQLALCPSVRKPSFRSCVNEKMSALSYLLEDFHRIINNSETLRKRIAECPCLRHRAARDMKELNLPGGPTLWHEQLRSLPSRFCGMATCAKEEQPSLRIGEDEPPKLRRKVCTTSSCPHCGFAKKMGLGHTDCKVFSECEELMDATLWKEVPRNGGRTQREPTLYTGADRKTVAEVFDILVDEVAPVALEHLGEAQWWHTNVERKVATFKSNELLIFTDFSATPELVAKEVGNCHEANHCMIDVLVVLDNPRVVSVVQEDGTTIRKRINDCTYWAFLGPTDGKGKKNDHRFHREAMKEVVAFHTKKARDRSVVIDTVNLFTDNCGGQFKSQQNMGDVAWFAEEFPGMRLDHAYAPIFEFKGVHDGFGKIIKWRFKEAELKGIRVAIAEAGYGYIIDTYCGRRKEWDALEREASPKLLQRGFFNMTEVCAGFIADTEEEALSVKQKYGGEHVLRCDREMIPKTVGDKAAKGLTEIYNVRGKREPVRVTSSGKQFWELELSKRVCFCTVCCARDVIDQACPFRELREVRNIIVEDQSTDADWCSDQRAKRAVSLYFRKEFKYNGYVNMKRMTDELQRLEIPFPDNASRIDLCHFFLSLMKKSGTIPADQEELLLAISDEAEFPEPSVDDDFVDPSNEQELPNSEEESPSGADQFAMNDIDDEEADANIVLSDNELKDMTDFGILGDPVLNFQLAHRRLPTTGSRAEREERLGQIILSL